MTLPAAGVGIARGWLAFRALGVALLSVAFVQCGAPATALREQSALPSPTSTTSSLPTAGDRGEPAERITCTEPMMIAEDREEIGVQQSLLSPNPPMRSGLGVGTRGEGRGTRRSALDSDKWGRWRPLVGVGGADGGPGQRRWGGVGGTACKGRQSRTGPVRLCGVVE